MISNISSTNTSQIGYRWFSNWELGMTRHLHFTLEQAPGWTPQVHWNYNFHICHHSKAIIEPIKLSITFDEHSSCIAIKQAILFGIKTPFPKQIMTSTIVMQIQLVQLAKTSPPLSRWKLEDLGGNLQIWEDVTDDTPNTFTKLDMSFSDNLNFCMIYSLFF